MAGSIDLGQVVGAPGAGIPTGGNDGQVLVKNGSANYSGRWENRPKTVNYIEPDPDGNIPINVVNYANQLVADDAQQSTGEFILRTTGGDASIADGDAWLMVLKGRSVHTGYSAESLSMTVTPAARGEGEYEITATIDRDIFVAAVSGSTTIILTYSSSWSADPATYGVTVSGTPVSGDEIEIVYVAEVRGTITQATPSSFVSTGWNLYDHTNTYAKVTKYSDTYGFLVGGTYTALQYSATLAGEKTSITVTGGSFQIPGDGYVWVTGGDSTTTYIMMTWSDWTGGYEGSWKAYTESEIDLSEIMEDFPYGLMQAGTAADEIDLNTMTATSRIERLSYTAENIAAAKASGRQYEYDEDYIYIEKASATVYDIDLDGSYTACDHGIEFFVGTDVAVYIETLYGQNLKDKLRTDVLTKSQDLVDNLNSSDATKALSAKQGKVLNDNFTNLQMRYLNQSGDDLDNLYNTSDTGFYITGSSTGHSPAAYCATVVIARNGTCTQIVFGGTYIYVRIRSGSPLAWGAWRRVATSTYT